MEPQSPQVEDSGEIDNPLTKLLHRLEAATSRLEDIASSSQSLEGEKPAHGTAAAAVSRTASVNGDVGPVSAAAPSSTATSTPTPSTAAPVVELPKQLEDFDQLIKDDAMPFQNLSAKIGGLVADSVCDIHAA